MILFIFLRLIIPRLVPLRVSDGEVIIHSSVSFQEISLLERKIMFMRLNFILVIFILVILF